MNILFHGHAHGLLQICYGQFNMSVFWIVLQMLEQEVLAGKKRRELEEEAAKKVCKQQFSSLFFCIIKVTFELPGCSFPVIDFNALVCVNNCNVV